MQTTSSRSSLLIDESVSLEGLTHAFSFGGQVVGWLGWAFAYLRSQDVAPVAHWTPKSGPDFSSSLPYERRSGFSLWVSHPNLPQVCSLTAYATLVIPPGSLGGRLAPPHPVARHHCAWSRYSGKLGLENELDAHRKQRSVLPPGSRGRHTSGLSHLQRPLSSPASQAPMTRTPQIGCAVFDPYP